MRKKFITKAWNREMDSRVNTPFTDFLGIISIQRCWQGVRLHHCNPWRNVWKECVLSARTCKAPFPSNCTGGLFLLILYVVGKHISHSVDDCSEKCLFITILINNNKTCLLTQLETTDFISRITDTDFLGSCVLSWPNRTIMLLPLCPELCKCFHHRT